MPATRPLADLFRALGLVEKQGLGVDRMYREMVTLGHRPPLIVEDGGPRVHMRLVGGHPVVPVMALAGGIEPAIRRRDVRVALVVDALLREPFITADRIAGLLQRTVSETGEAIDATAECRVDSQPLLSRYKDVWRLSPAAVSVVENAAPATSAEREGSCRNDFRRSRSPSSAPGWRCTSGSPPGTRRDLPGSPRPAR